MDLILETNGIIVDQEQIMLIARKMANFTLGEADILRRAMSKKKYDILKKEEEKFIKGSINRGYTKEISKKVFDLILNFANYGFNRAHSVAYSIIAYKMAYLKAKYPKYFFANLLTSVIGSETKTREYITEARSYGIEILPPDIIKSNVYYTVEDNISFSEGSIYSIFSFFCFLLMYESILTAGPGLNNAIAANISSNVVGFNFLKKFLIPVDSNWNIPEV